MITVLQGDCLDVLPTLGERFAACVTDPPYLLNFMGKSWDRPDTAPCSITPFEAWFAGFAAGEGCFRVQRHKDGKYYTCTFAIHLRGDDAPVLRGLQQRIGGRIVLGIERTNRQGITSSPDVRWLVETREGCWAVARILDRMPLFAKKAADYALWRRALQLWTDTPRGNRWHGPRDVGEMASIMEALQTVKRYSGDIASLDFDPFMPPAQAFHYQWARAVFDTLLPGAHLVAFSGTRTQHRMVCGIEDAGFEIRDTLCWLHGQGFPKSLNVPPFSRVTDRAEFAGFGTALKPAVEMICLARKPLIGTVAANVLAHGTGALNVDACRVGFASEADRAGAVTGQGTSDSIYGGGKGLHPAEMGTQAFTPATAGRWPANVLHDGSAEVEAAFAAFGSRTSGELHPWHDAKASDNGSMSGGNYAGRVKSSFGGDTGTASRFFFSSKADKGDRADSSHPTVKPVSLMRWLVRLVTPPGGAVIDPFAGSGTTGEAAMLEGFDATLIERDATHAADIAHRIKRWSGLDAPLFADAAE